jgi:carbon storage regulator
LSFPARAAACSSSPPRVPEPAVGGNVGDRPSEEDETVLIITRKTGEKIMLGDEIVVEVIEVSGSSVRLGIAAPRALPVYREEIWTAVKEERAGTAAGGDRLPEQQ